MSVLLVNADSVADYLRRYYKQDRLRSVDNAYGPGTLLDAYERDFARDGYVSTSHHDNVIGEHIYWPVLPPWMQGRWVPAPDQPQGPWVIYVRAAEVE